MLAGLLIATSIHKLRTGAPCPSWSGLRTIVPRKILIMGPNSPIRVRKRTAAAADKGNDKNVSKKPSKRKRVAKPSEQIVSPYFSKSTVKLQRSFFDQDTISLSKALLGKVLCRRLPGTGEIVKGTIVETEAYPGVGDAASQSCKGTPTERNMAMFMDPGTAYVYMTYGMYFCFNISAKEYGGASLLRAVEVLEDYEVMQSLRRPRPKKNSEKKQENDGKPLKRFKPHELTNGPSKLCLSFDINRQSCDKIDLTSSDDLWLEVSKEEKYRSKQFEIEESRRVGIESTPPEARNRLYRFFVKDNLSVSKARFKDTSTKIGKKTSKRNVKK